MIVVLFLLTVSLVLASPMPRFKRETTNATTNAATDFTLPPISRSIRVNGEPVLGVASNEIVDVRAYAQKYCSDWTRAPDFQVSQSTMDIKGSYAAYLRLEYSTAVQSCQASEPQIISRDDLFYCNSGDTCELIKKLATSHTDNLRYGFALGTSVSAGVDVKVVQVEVTASAEYSMEWEKTDTVSKELQFTRYLNRGEVCSPMTIQFSTRCQSHIQISSFAVYDENGQKKHPDINNVCSYFTSPAERDNYVRGQGLDAAKVAQICSSSVPTNAAGILDLDVISKGQSKPLLIDGCAFS